MIVARCTGAPDHPVKGCGAMVPLLYGDGKPFRARDGAQLVYIESHGVCGWRTADATSATSATDQGAHDGTNHGTNHGTER